MTGIWSETVEGWRPLVPVGFTQEAELAVLQLGDLDGAC
jgi:hypothetical protein